MLLRVVDIKLFLDQCRTRLPFRFGVSTLTTAPLGTVRVEVEVNGTRQTGAAADLLVPKWFAKDPGETVRDDVAALVASARGASADLLEIASRPATVFEHWWELHRRRVTAAPRAGDRLRHGFGVALLERAMIDAACRAAGTGLFGALQGDLLGFRSRLLRPDLPELDATIDLPAAPRDRVAVRHTVGLLDALCEADLGAADRVDDGLPETLEADIARYGLRSFKLKLCGRRDDDLRRLDRIGGVLRSTAREPARVTLDGNEQFEEIPQLVATLEALRTVPNGSWLLERLISIEQPLARAVTYDAARHEDMDVLTRFAPVIIDEADDDVDAFPRAVALGYRGVSVKNCKGVFRALSNRVACARSDGLLFQSAEDLTNLPVIALQQDLCTVATLGLEHVERNGHHYFRGLAHLPADEVEAALAVHGDLYERLDGTAALRIVDGELALASVHGPGYGYGMPIRWDLRTPAEEWAWVERDEG